MRRNDRSHQDAPLRDAGMALRADWSGWPQTAFEVNPGGFLIGKPLEELKGGDGGASRCFPFRGDTVRPSAENKLQLTDARITRGLQIGAQRSEAIETTAEPLFDDDLFRAIWRYIRQYNLRPQVYQPVKMRGDSESYRLVSPLLARQSETALPVSWLPHRPRGLQSRSFCRVLTTDQ